MSDRAKGAAAVLLIIFGFMFFLLILPTLQENYNTVERNIQKADDRSSYETLKKVEDTCRAMIASYKADVLTYEQYKDSPDKEKQSWAEQAKMRANQTATTYNEYMLKNSFVWHENIPRDIFANLEYMK